MPDEGKITPWPKDHPALHDAVRAMRRAQAWAVVAVDREITVGIIAPQMHLDRHLPQVTLITHTALKDIDYSIAFFECIQQVVGQYLEAMRKQRDEGEGA